MKIHPFLTVVQGPKQASGKRVARQQPEEAAAGRETQPTSTPRDVVDVVSMENKRAQVVTPPRDIEEAEVVLKQVTEQIGDLEKGDLRGLHRLEGLVHFHSV